MSYQGPIYLFKMILKNLILSTHSKRNWKKLICELFGKNLVVNSYLSSHVRYYFYTHYYMYHTLYFVNSVYLISKFILAFIVFYQETPFPHFLLILLSILALLLLLTLFFTLRELYVIRLMVSFGLPRHFHFLLCNCLVLSLLVFCGKRNK